jgi:hypothetical protein
MKIKLLSVLALLTFVVANCGDNAMAGYENDDYGSLDPAIESQIKQDYLVRRGNQSGFTVEGVSLGYVGTYNGYAVVVLELYTGAMCTAMPLNVSIAGFNFAFSCNYCYLVWKDGQFYEWELAYDQGFLAQDDVGNIHHRLNS